MELTLNKSHIARDSGQSFDLHISLFQGNFNTLIYYFAYFVPVLL